MGDLDLGGGVGPSGSLGLKVIRGDRGERLSFPDAPAELKSELSMTDLVRFGFPQAGLPAEVNEWRRTNLRHLWRGLWRVAAARRLGLPHFYGTLYLQLRRDGRLVDLGLASMRVVTTVGAGYIVDAFQNLVELENQKFHGFGTGTNAEAVGDTALQTELTTQYNPDSTRPTGTTAEASALVYQTVATLTPDAGGTIAVTEHGVFSAASAGVLFDRSVFSAVNVVASADSLQATYQATFSAGG